MEYCSVLAGAPNYYLELLDKLQKLEPLIYYRNIASLRLFYW